MSIILNGNTIAGNFAPRSYRFVGEIFQSAIPIQDIRVALLDGHIITSSQGYDEFIKHLTSISNTYPQLICTESEWQSSNLKYGECGKFVINEDGSVRLPKITSFVQGLSSLSDLATLVEAGLPNITASSNQIDVYATPSVDGAFYWSDIYDNVSYTSGTQNGGGTLHFDASRSNPIYNNSDTVQPQSIRYPYYIVLSTYVAQHIQAVENIEFNSPFYFGWSQYSTIAPKNLSWLQSIGQWTPRNDYPDFYDWLAEIYSNPDKNNSVSVKSSTSSYTDYDFVLNLENLTFRLPLLNGTEDISAQSIGTLYYYVGETVSNASLVDAGRLTEKVINLNEKLINLNEKVDKNEIVKKITNCIIEVPQRVKIELDGGNIVLKAGSIVTVPNGFEENGELKCDYITIENDLSMSCNFNGSYTDGYVCYNVTTKTLSPARVMRTESHSTSELPETLDSPYYFWWNPNTNLVTYYSNNVQQSGLYSLPIGLFSNTASIFNGVKTFNGIGYFGSTIWLDKGLKVLVPNGKNEDGSLNNIEYTIDKFRLYAPYTFNRNKQPLVLSINPNLHIFGTGTNMYYESKQRPTLATYITWFNTAENKMYHTYDTTDLVNYPCVYLGSCTLTNGRISDFNIKNIFDSTDEKAYIVESYVNGTSWYRVWSDGWCEQGGQTAKINNTSTTVSFIKAFRSTTPFYINIQPIGGDTNQWAGQYYCVKSFTTSNFTFIGASGASSGYIWIAKGYIKNIQ